MREIINLNQGWKFIREDAGLPVELPEHWQDVDLPHTWNGVDGIRKGWMKMWRNLPDAGSKIYIAWFPCRRTVTGKNHRKGEGDGKESIGTCEIL